MKNQSCSTFLLSDLPSSLDEFGSHQKVADAISSLILSENEGGKTIGVEGEWGAGKSTVIKLIESSLSKNNDILVFLFDAWAHRDDPLRRTFLESLITQIEEMKWVDPAIWSKRRAVLGKSLVFERKVVNSNLKVWARWFIVSALFVPIGMALLNSGLNSNSHENIVALRMVIGFLFALLPVGILLYVLIKNNIEQRQEKESGSEQEDPWSFLIQNSMTDTSSHTFQTPNPTSLEFSKAFSDLMDSALNNKERKIVIVLDNLDRVDANDALSLLSTLQTFLQDSNSKSPWLSRLWIIIPYDRVGLEMLWKTGQNQGQLATNSSVSTDIATSFIDKRFQIRFEVPPIVLSNWSAYLKRLLKNALPNHPEDEFHAVYRAYMMNRSNEDHSPTPRELKLFVNQIGAIHRQWQDEFPLFHIGYYILQKRKGENIIKNLLTGKYKQPQIEAFFGSGLIDSLTALSFNVEVAQARQLLLKEPIEIVLREGDAKRFSELMNHPGFSEVLESISFSEWTNEQALYLTNAAEILHAETTTSSLTSDTIRGIKREFRRALLNTHTWPPITQQISRGIASVFDLVDADDNLIKQTLNTFSDAKYGTHNENPAELYESIKAWIEGVIFLLDSISNSKNINELFANKIAIPFSANLYIEGCALLHDIDHKKNYWHIFKSKDSFAEIVIELSKLATTSGVNETQIKAVKVLQQQAQNHSWTALLNQVKSMLSSTSNYQPEHIKNVLELFWELKADSEFQSSIKTIVKQGFILHFLNLAKKDPDASAYCIFSFLYVYPDARNITQQGESENGRAFINQLFKSPDSHIKIVEKIVDLLYKHEAYDLPFNISLSENTLNLANSVLKLAAIHNDAHKVFTAENIIRNWRAIGNSVDSKNIDPIIEKLIVETDIVKQIINSDFSTSNASLYSSLVRGGAVKDDAFKGWCINGLKSIDQDEMQLHINKNDFIAELIVDLIDNEIVLDLGTEFQEIIYNHSVALMNDEVKVDYLDKYWDRLLQPLNSHARETLRDRIVDKLIQQNGKISQDFFTIYGSELFSAKGLSGNRHLVLNIFTPLIKNSHLTGIKWMLRLLEAKPTLLANYSPKSHVDDMLDWLKKAVSDNSSEEVIQSLQKFALIIEKTLEDGQHHETAQNK